MTPLILKLGLRLVTFTTSSKILDGYQLAVILDGGTGLLTETVWPPPNEADLKVARAEKQARADVKKQRSLGNIPWSARHARSAQEQTKSKATATASAAEKATATTTT